MAAITFVYNKSNKSGIIQDVNLLEKAFSGNRIRHNDYLEPPVISDLAIYFEIPIYGWFPWARVNCLFINPEWWEDGWAPYLTHLDALVFKSQHDKDFFVNKYSSFIPSSLSIHTITWTTLIQPSSFIKLPKSSTAECLWLLGKSNHRHSAAKFLLPRWKESYPPLHVYSQTSLDISGTLPPNVHLKIQDLPEQTRLDLQAFYPIHLIFSESESAGMTSLEGLSAGAYLIGNSLPCFKENLSSSQATLLPSSLTPYEGKGGVRDTFENFSDLDLEECLNKARLLDFSTVRKSQQEYANQRSKQFFQESKSLLTALLQKKKTIKSLPPILSDSECPPISIITLLYNRRKFVDLAFHNLLITDYPKDKIEWVIVDDSDDVNEQASDKIMKFARDILENASDTGKAMSKLQVTYVPLPSKTAIGEKRNMGVQRAQHDILLMMDDDDHYPSSSFRRRVSWLMKQNSLKNIQATACTTIACYDLLKGTSAVNTPPFTLGLSKRISEATLTFTREFWLQKPFPTVNISEGEGFLEGRESNVLELQPQQIIVSMTHQKNISSRRFGEGTPSCFWGFPKEFLIFLHRLANVEIEEDTSNPNSKKVNTKSKSKSK